MSSWFSSRNVISLVGFLLIGGAFVYLAFNSKELEAEPLIRPPQTSLEEPSTNYTVLPSPTTRIDEAAKKTALLSQLISEWDALAPRTTHSATSEHHALAKKTATLLGCSVDTLELLRYFEEEGYTTLMGRLVRREVETLFAVESASEARDALLALPQASGFGDLPASVREYVDHWAHAAGSHCSAEAFSVFFPQLGKSGLDSSAVQEAIFGYNIQMASTSPEQALRSTVEALSNNLVSPNLFTSLSALVQNLPDAAAYEELVSLLPRYGSGSNTSPINNGYHQFFRTWAQSHPAGAAQYVIDNDAMPPELLSTIAEVVLGADPAVGVEWVQSFPEGEYFDYAAKTAMHYIGEKYPKEARELASLIGNDAIREESMKIIDGRQARIGLQR